jgi:hypothetical protein
MNTPRKKERNTKMTYLAERASEVDEKVGGDHSGFINDTVAAWQPHCDPEQSAAHWTDQVRRGFGYQVGVGDFISDSRVNSLAARLVYGVGAV